MVVNTAARRHGTRAANVRLYCEDRTTMKTENQDFHFTEVKFRKKREHGNNINLSGRSED